MNSIKTLNKLYRRLLDSIVPYPKERWVSLAVLSLYVFYRVLVYDFLAIMFLWGLYVLYLIVQFFTPSGLPDPDEDNFEYEPPCFEESEELNIPDMENILESEDRPLLRTITEFHLWKNLMATMAASLISTLSEVFQIPVYWPFLFIYFIWLIGLAIIKHFKHMKKYGYSPKDFASNKRKRGQEENFI